MLVGLYKIAPENTKAINIHSDDSILDLFDLNDVPKGIAGSVGKWTRRIRRTSPRWTGCKEGRERRRRRRRVENRTHRGPETYRSADAAEPPLEPSYAKPPEPDKPIEEMTEDERRRGRRRWPSTRWPRARKKKEAEEAARIAAGRARGAEDRRFRVCAGAAAAEEPPRIRPHPRRPTPTTPRPRPSCDADAEDRC